MLPYLTSPPISKKTSLDDHIIIMGAVEDLIHPESGHNLYMANMQQLVDWIDRNVILGRPAWTSMMEWYRSIGLDIDDLPPERTYKRWQRMVRRKKAENKLYESGFDVLKNTTPHLGGLKLALEAAGRVINTYPDLFFTISGEPDPSMMRKAIIYAMADLQGWDQITIADHFGTTQQNISKHLTSIRAILRRLDGSVS